MVEKGANLFQYIGKFKRPMRTFITIRSFLEDQFRGLNVLNFSTYLTINVNVDALCSLPRRCSNFNKMSIFIGSLAPKKSGFLLSVKDARICLLFSFFIHEALAVELNSTTSDHVADTLSTHPFPPAPPQQEFLKDLNKLSQDELDTTPGESVYKDISLKLIKGEDIDHATTFSPVIGSRSLRGSAT